MRAFIFATCLLLSANTLAASYITVLEDNRYVRVAGYTFDNYQPREYYDNFEYPVSQGADFEYVGVFAPDAQHQSSLPVSAGGPDVISANAQVYRDSGDTGISGYSVAQDSVFDVTFVANAGFNYAVNFAGEIFNGSVALYSGSAIDNNQALFSFTSDFDVNTALVGGQSYRLVATALLIDNPISDASFDFVGSFAPTIVPVPAAIWLFASALAGLGWVKGRSGG